MNRNWFEPANMKLNTQKVTLCLKSCIDYLPPSLKNYRETTKEVQFLVNLANRRILIHDTKILELTTKSAKMSIKLLDENNNFFNKLQASCQLATTYHLVGRKLISRSSRVVWSSWVGKVGPKKTCPSPPTSCSSFMS